MKRLILFAVAAASLTAAANAGTSATRELPESYVFSALPPPAPRFAGDLTPLRQGVAYTARELPISIRITPPDGRWTGAQWKSARLGERGGGAPYFGFAALAVGRNTASSLPRGLVVLETAYDRTPSVAQTVKRLRTRGRWATYSAPSPAALAGFSGVALEGQVAAGHLHVFEPFSDAGHFVDAFYAGPSERFRVLVLGVRGRTVVVYLDGIGLSPDQFPTFVDQADRLLATLRFPNERTGGSR